MLFHQAQVLAKGNEAIYGRFGHQYGARAPPGPRSLMKLDYFFGGASILAIGLAVFLGWPPIFLHDLPLPWVEAGVSIGVVLMAIGTLISLASLTWGRKMWPWLLVGMCLLGLVVAGRELFIRATVPTRRPDAKNFPQVMAAFRGEADPGPYNLMMLNSSGGPIINASVRIQPAGTLFDVFDAQTIKLGDIETGITQIQAKLPLGYYQINTRFRGDGGFVVQMLLLAFQDGKVRQYAWLGDGQGKIAEPEGGTPRLPVYSPTIEPLNGTDPVEADLNMVTAPLTPAGLQLQYLILGIKNRTKGDLAIRLSNVQLSADGKAVSKLGETEFSPTPADRDWSWTWTLPTTYVAVGTKTITVDADILAIAAKGDAPEQFHRKITYTLDWGDDIGKQPAIHAALSRN